MDAVSIARLNLGEIKHRMFLGQLRWFLACVLTWLWLCTSSLAWAAGTWEYVGPGGGNVQALVSSSDGQTLFAGTSRGGVLKTTDAGATWTAVNNGLNHLDVPSLARGSDGQTLFAGTSGGGVFKTTDAGANWTAANNGLTNLSVRSLALGSDGQTLFAGTFGGGIFKTTDAGATWTTVNNGMSDVTVRSLAQGSDGQALFAGTSGGVFKTTDAGATWRAVNNGLNYRAAYSLALGRDGQTLFAGTSGGVFKTTDAGATWSAVNNGLTNLGVSSLALGSDGQTLFAGTSGGVFKTTDAGANWTAVNNGLPNLFVYSLALGSDGQTLFAVPRTGSVFKMNLTVAPTEPNDVRATPSASGEVGVTWTPPANTGAGTISYRVTAQPGGQTCAPASPSSTSCTVTGLQNGQTYTFTVVASNGAGPGPSSASSNPATPLANSKSFSYTLPDSTEPVTAEVSGGGNTCRFEYVRAMTVQEASTPPPSNLKFPHGLLDFVLTDCDQTDVTVALTYPSDLAPGAQYWKLNAGTWAPYSGATVQAGGRAVVLTMRDGGPGDDDGRVNGRIVDPGHVAFMDTPFANPTPVPTLSTWALGMLGFGLAWLGGRRKSSAHL